MTRGPAAAAGFNAALLAWGGLGALAARAAGLPMPWLTGSLAASALAVALASGFFPADYVFPQRLRLFFVGVIGAMIGARVAPELLSHLSALGVTLSAVALFVLVAQVGNYVLFRRLGGYDRPTAWFSGSPGGLIEAVSMGETAGADLRVLTLLQFLRIISVVTILPFALSLYHGTPVGSAAGLSLGQGVWGAPDLGLILAFVGAGLGIGRALHLPAAPLTGPLLVAAAWGMAGPVPLASPGWLAALAQMVMGVSLGTRFFGVNARLLLRAVGMSVSSVGFMLAIGAAFALGVHHLTGLDFELMFISLAPGGVTEMSLVALSLSANPAIVTLHHLVRIAVTVLFLGLAQRLGLVGSAAAGGDP